MKTENSMKVFTAKEVAAVCDHTFLKRADAYRENTQKGTSPIQSRKHDFFQFLKQSCELDLAPFAVCVRAEDVPHAKRFLEEQGHTSMKVVATVGFPEGSWYKTKYKYFEAQYALGEGADEIDMVIDHQGLIEGDHGRVFQEVKSITQIVHDLRGVMKLILETSALNRQLIVQACHLAAHAGVDFVKTSTGYGAYGVRSEDLEIICQNFQGGIKISGGVTPENLNDLLSVIYRVRGHDFTLDPKKIRIGESSLIEQLMIKGC